MIDTQTNPRAALLDILTAYTSRPQLDATKQHPTDYGRAALRYILAADVDLFGLFTSEELDACAHAARWAVTARDLSPTAAERITQVHLQIVAVLARRQAEQLEAAGNTSQPRVQVQLSTLAGGTGGIGGTKVPVPTGPRNQPPAPERMREPERMEVRF